MGSINRIWGDWEVELRTGEQSEILVLGILEDAGGYWKLERAGEYQVTKKLLGIWGIEGGIPRVRGIPGIPGVTRGVPDTRGWSGLCPYKAWENLLPLPPPAPSRGRPAPAGAGRILWVTGGGPRSPGETPERHRRPPKGRGLSWGRTPQDPPHYVSPPLPLKTPGWVPALTRVGSGCSGGVLGGPVRVLTVPSPVPLGGFGSLRTGRSRCGNLGRLGFVTSGSGSLRLEFGFPQARVRVP